jgi:hypothetical protein
MRSFFKDRGPWLAAVVLIMFGVSLAQSAISYTLAFGALRNFLPIDRAPIASLFIYVRFASSV